MQTDLKMTDYEVRKVNLRTRDMLPDFHSQYAVAITVTYV